MSQLRTDYKDDILDVSVNTQRKYRQVDNGDGTISFVDVTVYSQQGDTFGAGDVNKINSSLVDLITGTIPSGETSITLTDEKIKSDSIIDIYFENKVLAPTEVTVNDGSIVIVIDAQETNTNVGVRCL
jgi:hypothetical protein